MSSFNGTSSAAPVVSGVVSLMLEANPDLTWRDVKHILAQTSSQVDSSFVAVDVDGQTYHRWVNNAAGYKFHNWYGFGRIDASAAVERAVGYSTGILGTAKYLDWNVSGDINRSLAEGVKETFTININTSGTVEFVRAAISYSHEDSHELGFRLRSPSGTVTTLLQPKTALADNPDGSYIFLPANAFYGEAMQGNWTLLAFDHESNFVTATIYDWAIDFHYR